VFEFGDHEALLRLMASRCGQHSQARQSRCWAPNIEVSSEFATQVLARLSLLAESARDCGRQPAQHENRRSQTCLPVVLVGLLILATGWPDPLVAN
jgi:hypothetical protein